MALPVEHEARQQIGPAQERRIRRVAPPSTTWLPPPVPVWRPSVMNLSVPSRDQPRLFVKRRGGLTACRQERAGGR